MKIRIAKIVRDTWGVRVVAEDGTTVMLLPLTVTNYGETLHFTMSKEYLEDALALINESLSPNDQPKAS